MESLRGVTVPTGDGMGNSSNARMSWSNPVLGDTDPIVSFPKTTDQTDIDALGSCADDSHNQESQSSGFGGEVVPLLGLAAMCSLRTRRPSGTPMALVGQSLPVETMDEPATVMHTAGGRRKRLGVGGRICMLTGVKKIKGVVRTYHLKKNCRYWRPNTMWKNLWWDKEKKWVRLYICVDALPYVAEPRESVFLGRGGHTPRFVFVLPPFGVAEGGRHEFGARSPIGYRGYFDLGMTNRKD
ncbi:unnamed protein product [Durusdinium trenchii]|uniref:Uncharacterized protein n=1 Tax=Durusdinium trenchii TaxID=1381693 RepID=A0ABP0HY50_9DINO